MSVEAFAIASVRVAGGGTIGLCRLPGRFGSLGADLDHVAEWQPTVVISLTETAESAALGAGRLPAMLGARGTMWEQFPIEDFGVPTAAVNTQWPPLSKRLHALLDQGQKVLLHCRGGLGRSGMVAVRLLVERGGAFDAALLRVRAARPGAVETDAQMDWARGRRPA